MENPLVSVLLASYNHAPYVEAAVRSVMEQAGVSFELLVIDDGSTDESPQILKGLAEKLHFDFISRPNKGLVPTMNEMLALAHGKYFCSLASDDIMPAGRLKTQTEYLESHPEKVACFGQIIHIDADGCLSENPEFRYWRSRPEVTFEDLILGNKELHGCTEMVRTAVFREVGGYNEQVKTEDFAMFCALSSRFGPLPVLDTVCCDYRLHGNNMHFNSDLIYPETIKAIRLYASPVLCRKAVARWKAYWFSHLAYVNKMRALKMFPQLVSLSWDFWKRIPKLFIPKCLLKQ
jgi:glycosyltransferase involved in cell wall biosynthesis